MSNEPEKYSPRYLDKNGNEIKAGMRLLMEDGSIELVYDTVDGYGNPDLGVNASNEAFLENHPEWAREYYSLSSFNTAAAEICLTAPEIQAELEKLEPIIQGTELALDYSEPLPEGEYERYEAAIARREVLTAMMEKPAHRERDDAR